MVLPTARRKQQLQQQQPMATMVDRVGRGGPPLINHQVILMIAHQPLQPKNSAVEFVGLAGPESPAKSAEANLVLPRTTVS